MRDWLRGNEASTRSLQHDEADAVSCPSCEQLRGDLESETRWAKQYHDEAQGLKERIARAVEILQQVSTVFRMMNGYDEPEISKALAALKGEQPCPR